MLAVKQESSVRVVVHSVVTENNSLLVLEQSDFFFLEYDFYLINWTRENFAPQIQINK
jgi:hypothetical protein